MSLLYIRVQSFPAQSTGFGPERVIFCSHFSQKYFLNYTARLSLLLSIEINLLSPQKELLSCFQTVINNILESTGCFSLNKSPNQSQHQRSKNSFNNWLIYLPIEISRMYSFTSFLFLFVLLSLCCSTFKWNLLHSSKQYPSLALSARNSTHDNLSPWLLQFQERMIVNAHNLSPFNFPFIFFYIEYREN